ncbi:MAG: ABC transporter substrate-binding protein [Candidatus Bipolaricaulota bacterium]
MRLRSVLSVVLLVGALSGLGLAQVGPFADGILYNVRMQEEIALQDVAAGNIDIFQYTTAGSVIFGLDQATLDKLELYVVPASSESLFLNPYPNAAPYIAVTTSGEEKFNPFAIRELRFALHFLLNRQQMVEEIMQGAGSPSIISVGSFEPGAFKLYLEAQKLGLTPEGDQAKAYQMIDDAMNAAAALPENVGRLARGGDGIWTFDGAPVEINFYIRVDDPNVRLPMGRRIADQLRQAGFVVNNVEVDRTRCISDVYLTDPADYLWNIYTEGWLAGGTSLWKDVDVVQMYAPWYTNMPGIGESSWWNYQHPELDAWTQAIIYGQFETVDEYWELMSKSVAAGLTEAVRIYQQHDFAYYAANKAAFETRFLYGLGDGLNRDTMISMVPTNKTRPVVVSQFSARGSLFLNAWDPVGTQGFNDAYAANIITNTTDPNTTTAPGSAAYTPVISSWSNVVVDVEFADDGTAVGQLAAPANAVEWDSTAKAWVSTAGEAAWAKADYTFQLANFHDGSETSLLDFAQAEGFLTDWAVEDYEGDPYFDSGISSAILPGFAYTHGSVWDFANAKITTYFDNNFPPDLDRVGASGAPTFWPRASNHGQGVKWTIIEALGKLVAEGGESGTVYGFTQATGVTQVDVLVRSIVSDIRAKLVEMRDQKFVPVYLAPLLPEVGATADDLAAMYQSAIDFIDAHGHAYISNGPYYIDSVDPANSQISLKANRDPSYPWSAQYWLDEFETGVTRVDDVVTPLAAQAGQNVTITILASEGLYPYDVFEPATKAAVSLIFVGPAGETTIVATLKSAGQFEVVIPGSVTAGLGGGAYTIVAVAEPAGGGLPTASGATLLLQ